MRRAVKRFGPQAELVGLPGFLRDAGGASGRSSRTSIPGLPNGYGCGPCGTAGLIRIGRAGQRRRLAGRRPSAEPERLRRVRVVVSVWIRIVTQFHIRGNDRRGSHSPPASRADLPDSKQALPFGVHDRFDRE